MRGVWAQMSTATGYMNLTWPGTPQGPMTSIYQKMRQRNLCMHRGTLSRAAHTQTETSAQRLTRVMCVCVCVCRVECRFPEHWRERRAHGLDGQRDHVHPGQEPEHRPPAHPQLRPHRQRCVLRAVVLSPLFALAAFAIRGAHALVPPWSVQMCAMATTARAP